MVVISDTSPITNLIKIERLGLLKDVFGKVFIPTQIKLELEDWNNPGFDISIIEDASWIEILHPKNLELITQLKNELDGGEAAAIALASELKANYLIIDERKGWKIAKSFGINAIGLIGVLLNAKSLKIIKEVMPIVDELRINAGFWISDAFYQKIKTLTKE